MKREDSPKDLEDKSTLLASQLLELTGKAKKGHGLLLAKEILDSGKALAKFNEIINAQGRKRNSLNLASHRRDILAGKSGKIIMINSKKINHLCRVLGCPVDKGSGIYLHKKVSNKVSKGEPIAILYSESESRLKEAYAHFLEDTPMVIR